MSRYWLVSVLLCLWLAACTSVVEPGTTAAAAQPSLDRDGAERLALAADEARRIAYERADPAPLVGLYTPSLLAAETHHLAGLAQHGTSVEETSQQRRAVHVALGRGTAEVVLAVQGRQRLVTRGMAPRPLTAFLRQSAIDFAWASGGWLVEATHDLPPDRWWR